MQLNVHRLDFVEIRAILGLNVPRVHRRTELKIVIIGHGIQILAGMGRNESHFNAALRHQVIIAIIEVVPQRRRGSGRRAHDIIDAFGHHRRPQKCIIVFERFYESSFFQKVAVVFTHVARLLVASKRLRRSMQRQRNIWLGCVGLVRCIFHIAQAHIECAVCGTNCVQRARFHQPLVRIIKQHRLSQVAHFLQFVFGRLVDFIHLQIIAGFHVEINVQIKEENYAKY